MKAASSEIRDIFSKAGESVRKLIKSENIVASISESDLDKISSKATRELIQSMGISEENITPTEFAKLNNKVKSALYSLDSKMRDELAAECEKRLGKRKEKDPAATRTAIYKRMLLIKIDSEILKVLLTKNSEIASQFSEVAKEADRLLSKVKAKEAITKLHYDRQPAKETSFVDPLKKAGLTTGYRATRKNAKGTNETFMLKTAELKPDILGAREYVRETSSLKKSEGISTNPSIEARVKKVVELLTERVEKLLANLKEENRVLKINQLHSAMKKLGVDIKVDMSSWNKDDLEQAIVDALKAKHPNGEKGQDTVLLFLRDLNNELLLTQQDLTQFYDYRSDDTLAFFNEFLTAPLYKRMLFDRTPTIAGVDSNLQGEILLRSKYLDAFQIANEYKQQKSLRGVAGAGKLMAAMIAGGEFDMNFSNFGVIQENGKNVFAKIDHGQSAQMLSTDGEGVWLKFVNRCINFQYIKSMDINITELRESLDQILMITEEELETLLKARFYELKQMGFDPRALNFPDCIKINISTSDDSIDSVQDAYVEGFKNHWKALKQFRVLAEAVEKMTPPEGQTKETWQKGAYIDRIRDTNPIVYAIRNNLRIGSQDPVVYGYEKGLKVDGLDLILYAVLHKIKIDSKDPIEYVRENKLPVSDTLRIVLSIIAEGGKDKEGKDKDALSLLTDKYYDKACAPEIRKAIELELDGKSPLEFALLPVVELELFKFHTTNEKNALAFAVDKYYDKASSQGIKDYIKLGMGGKEPLEYAILHNVDINSVAPVDYALENNISVQGINPVAFAIKAGMESIDNFLGHYDQMAHSSGNKRAFFADLNSTTPVVEEDEAPNIAYFFSRLKVELANKNQEMTYKVRLGNIIQDFQKHGFEKVMQLPPTR